MKCKKCITDDIWVKFLPSGFLMKCESCKKLGIQLNKALKLGGTISIIIYFLSFSIIFF